ncbi:rhamnan synthesis F family protein [Allorhizobium pseudoryzae]|uniref:rhamnan synthesis F family protein n=1 Tax=Allorhizobium pseudoryzae TaxID=379684 RepID=UPI003CFDE0C3
MPHMVDFQPLESLTHADQDLRFLVFAHVHYPDIWEAMASELALAIKVPFGVVVTHCQVDAPIVRPNTPYLRYFRQLRVENRGRDVLPLLRALEADLPSSDLALKIHTKRSPHRMDGADWRAAMCASLLKFNDSGLLALQLLEQDERIGLIAPAGHYLPLRGRLTLNRRRMKKMLQVVLAKPVTNLEEHRFPAGSMFWFRRSCLLPFQATQLEQQFSVERGQLDATAAHAAERLFALVVEESGKVAMGMEAVEPILLQQKEGLMPKADMKALVEKCAQHEPNPYIIPLANHWRRYPALFLAAHIAYVYLPRWLTRAMRNGMQRVLR